MEDFSMGFLFSITILYLISLFMLIGKNQEPDVVK